MAVAANFDCPDRDKLQHCISKLQTFSFKDDDSSKTDINLLLDNLNSLDYDTKIVKDQVRLAPLKCPYCRTEH